jgi:hypothetical protein
MMDFLLAPSTVMAGLVPAIHNLDVSRGDAEAQSSRETSAFSATPRESFGALNSTDAWVFMDGRHEGGHDGFGLGAK